MQAPLFSIDSSSSCYCLSERQDLLQQQPITLKTCWPKLVCLARQRQKLVKRKGSGRDMAPHLLWHLFCIKTQMRLTLTCHWQQVRRWVRQLAPCKDKPCCYASHLDTDQSSLSTNCFLTNGVLFPSHTIWQPCRDFFCVQWRLIREEAALPLRA